MIKALKNAQQKLLRRDFLIVKNGVNGRSGSPDKDRSPMQAQGVTFKGTY
jgi:hypothetical protein